MFRDSTYYARQEADEAKEEAHQSREGKTRDEAYSKPVHKPLVR